MDIINGLKDIAKNPMRLFALGRLTLHWAVGYFSLQKNQQQSPTPPRIVETPTDDLIRPKADAVYPYLLGNLYVFYVGWRLITHGKKSDYKKALTAYTQMIDLSFELFKSHPTSMQNRSLGIHPLLTMVQSIDGETNCFPSLHVSLAMLSYHVLGQQSAIDPIVSAAMRRACIDIATSTLQTKQHSIVCVLGGYEIARRVFANTYGAPEHDFDDALIHETLKDLPPNLAQTLIKKARLSPDFPTMLIELLEILNQAER